MEFDLIKAILEDRINNYEMFKAVEPEMRVSLDFCINDAKQLLEIYLKQKEEQK